MQTREETPPNQSASTSNTLPKRTKRMCGSSYRKHVHVMTSWTGGWEARQCLPDVNMITNGTITHARIHRHSIHDAGNNHRSKPFLETPIAFWQWIPHISNIAFQDTSQIGEKQGCKKLLHALFLGGSRSTACFVVFVGS